MFFFSAISAKDLVDKSLFFDSVVLIFKSQISTLLLTEKTVHFSFLQFFFFF